MLLVVVIPQAAITESVRFSAATGTAGGGDPENIHRLKNKKEREVPLLIYNHAHIRRPLPLRVRLLLEHNGNPEDIVDGLHL